MKAKKLLAGALASALTMTAGFVPAAGALEMCRAGMTVYAEEEEQLAGDLNGSGTIDLNDVIRMGDFLLAGAETKPTDEEIAIADIDANGKINLRDLILASKIILENGEAVTGTTPADGGIIISDAEAVTGETNVDVPVFLSEEIGTTKGAFIKYVVPEGIELVSIERSFTYDEEKAIYINNEKFDTSEPLSHLYFDVPSDCAPGEYTISAEILALDDTNNGYYANPTVKAGTITVKEGTPVEPTEPDEPAEYDPANEPEGEPVYSGYNFDTAEKGMGIESVTVPYGRQRVELGIYVLNTNSGGCTINVSPEAPLSVVRFKNALMSEGSEAVFVSGEPIPNGEPFGKVIVDIDKNAQPGTYPVKVDIRQLSDRDTLGDVENPVSISGFVTIKEPDAPAETQPVTTDAPAETSAPEETYITISESVSVSYVYETTAPVDTAAPEETYISISVNEDGASIPVYVPAVTETTTMIPVTTEPEDTETEATEPVSKPDFDTDVKGVGVESVTVPYGTTEVELGLYMLNVKSTGGHMKFAAEAPLTITGFSKYMACEMCEDGKYEVLFLSANSYSTDTTFSSIKVAIAEDAEPGTYPVSFEIIQLDDNGAELSEPTAISGSITISEPQSEVPTEPTEEPTESTEPTEEPELPQTGNNAPMDLAAVLSAVMLTAAGAVVMKKAKR